MAKAFYSKSTVSGLRSTWEAVDLHCRGFATRKKQLYNDPMVFQWWIWQWWRNSWTIEPPPTTNGNIKEIDPSRMVRSISLKILGTLYRLIYDTKCDWDTNANEIRLKHVWYTFANCLWLKVTRTRSKSSHDATETNRCRTSLPNLLPVGFSLGNGWEFSYVQVT